MLKLIHTNFTTATSFLGNSECAETETN